MITWLFCSFVDRVLRRLICRLGKAQIALRLKQSCLALHHPILSRELRTAYGCQCWPCLSGQYIILLSPSSRFIHLLPPHTAFAYTIIPNAMFIPPQSLQTISKPIYLHKDPRLIPIFTNFKENSCLHSTSVQMKKIVFQTTIIILAIFKI